MKPKEKALELLDKYLGGYTKNGFNYSYSNDDEDSKQYVLIVVDEILKSFNVLEYYPEDLREYWNEVKEEIEKL